MMKRPKPAQGGGLFSESLTETKAVAMHRANIDGGSRGNPGPASYGVVIRDGSGKNCGATQKIYRAHDQ